MSMMMRYEWKKVFSRRGGRTALLLLAVTTALVCWFSCGVSYVDEAGVTRSGFSAAAKLRAQQKEWAGMLDEEKIRQVIAENKRITQSPQYLSEDLTEKEMAYHRIQAISDIRNLLNSSFAEAFRSYDYYRANKLKEEDAPQFYENRTALLEEWLGGEAAERFSEEEKAYLLERYESLETPFFYDYSKGWSQLFEYAPTMIMITVLILAGGYIGCLFLAFLGMLVSAKTKSAVIAVTVPFVLIFLPSFLMNLDHPVINKVICLLPDQLLQMGTALGYFSLYPLGGRIVGAVPILMVLYPVLTAVLIPAVYLMYGRKQIG